MRLTKKELTFLICGCASALAIFIIGISIRRQHKIEEVLSQHIFPINLPVREAPASFRQNTCMPNGTEGRISGSIDLKTFSPDTDLTEIHDDRVWWESDNDHGDTENDHVVHISLAEPLHRLIELVAMEEGALEVHDAYRTTGIHSPKSLHREGRAVDLTCDDLGLERLAILCWQAGFDWVYYENKAKNGAHIHCSVRRKPSHKTWIIMEDQQQTEPAPKP